MGGLGQQKLESEEPVLQSPSVGARHVLTQVRGVLQRQTWSVSRRG